ncbi:MAG: VWA-like domain-containing protein [Actinomycetia bacterium]|nr:VWA-like domain-containing protein [Actinomycetes bacterium]
MTELDLDKLSAAKLWLISPAPGGPPGTGGAGGRAGGRSAGAQGGGGPVAGSPRDLPYLATALYSLIPVPESRVVRMTCDEFWRVYVNPDWLVEASVPEVGAELAHLVWHLLLDHTARARDQQVDRSSAVLWDRCADATIAHTLSGASLVPGHLTTPADLNVRPGQSAEEYFALKSRLAALLDEPEPGVLEPGEGCGSGADGIPRQHEQGPETDIGALTRVDADVIREKVAIEYREGMRVRGSDPAGLLRWVEQVLTPRVPWEPLLAGAVRRAIGWAAGRGEYTYQRPSRRASSLPGIVLPGQHRPVPRISIIVDTSASVDDALLTRALTEVDGAIRALGLPGSHVSVYAVDAAVHITRRVRRAQDVQLVGAGGTDLRIGLRAVEQERPRPDIVIVFTDGETPWPSTPPPGAAVIIAVLGRRGWTLPRVPHWATRVDCLAD